MLDFSWSELLMIGAVALVAIGPKDLPRALRSAGTMVRKARSLAREFHNSIDEMIREAELEDVRRQLDQAARLVPTEPAAQTIAPPPEPAPPEPHAAPPKAP